MGKRVNFGATGRDVHIDVPLSNVAINYTPTGLIADMVFPIVNVAKQSDMIAVFSRGEALREENDRRAPGTAANRVTRSVSSDTYFANNYALSDAVVIEDRANADPIYVQQLYNNRAQWLKGKLDLQWERRLTNIVTSGTNVGSSSAVSSGWTDLSNADALGDVNNAIDNVFDSTGLKPNRIVFGEAAWRNFRRNTNVRDLINGVNNGGGFATQDQVANLLEVNEVLVGAGFANTAAEGQAEVLATLWGDNVLVYFAPEAASIEMPSLGYSFRWAAPGIPNMQAERHPFDSILKSELVELGYYQDEKITGAEYGYLITAVNSST